MRTGRQSAQFILEMNNSAALVGATATAELMRHLGLSAFGTAANTRPDQKIMRPSLPGTGP